MSTPERRKVHIKNEKDDWCFDRLWDDGTNILRFDSGHGYIDKRNIKALLWIHPGWVCDSEPAQQAALSS